MQRNLQAFKKKNYDLAVIGGGINGAAIAHLAALRGISTALVEKNDFSSGTSSKSSKLMHGGIRYLENMEFELVREALRERTFHIKAAPHLVRPLRFLIPVYEEDARPLWMMRLGTWLYDFIAGSAKIKSRRSLNAREVLEIEPGLKSEGLKGGVLYFDAQMDDARLCLENVMSAAELGVDAANYCEVIEFIKKDGKICGIEVKDNAPGGGGKFVIRAKKIICAAGPWSDRLLKLDDPSLPNKIRPTKGIHFVTTKKLSEDALLIPSARDKRIFFVMPWKGYSMVGTTDTDYSGDPDAVEADDSDVEYLLEETRRVFPSARLTKKDVQITFAGLRPLISGSGAASSVSREHEIFSTPSGLWCVAGGKYTTYRVIASECLAKIFPGSSGVEINGFYGSGVPPFDFDEEGLKNGLPRESVEVLWTLYGSRYKEVLRMAAEDVSLKTRINPKFPYIFAQLTYAQKTEMALTPEDVIYRRLSIGYSPPEYKSLEAEIGRFLENDRRL